MGKKKAVKLGINLGQYPNEGGGGCPSPNPFHPKNGTFSWKNNMLRIAKNAKKNIILYVLYVEAQQGDETNFSVESRYSDEDSEIKNILGSGQRDSRYVIKSDEESPRKSKCRKIPVLDTSESEFEESELSRAGFSNVAFDEKE